MVIAIILGSILGALAIFAIVFTTVAGAIRRQSAALLHRLEGEGILARTDKGWITYVQKHHLKKAPGELVLTANGLHAVGMRMNGSNVSLGRDELARCRAWSADGLLHVEMREPRHVELRGHLADPTAFLAALRERGADVP